MHSLRSNERTATEDGRRVNKWFLVDQRGVPHLAVVGVERETKDGHYSYHAVGGSSSWRGGLLMHA